MVRFISEDTAKEFVISPKEFRTRLNTVDKMLNIDPDSIPDDILPTEIQPKGSYAVAITWSDGHEASIYPFEDIHRLCEERAG